MWQEHGEELKILQVVQKGCVCPQILKWELGERRPNLANKGCPVIFWGLKFSKASSTSYKGINDNTKSRDCLDNRQT